MEYANAICPVDQMINDRLKDCLFLGGAVCLQPVREGLFHITAPGSHLHTL